MTNVDTKGTHAAILLKFTLYILNKRYYAMDLYIYILRFICKVYIETMKYLFNYILFTFIKFFKFTYMPQNFIYALQKSIDKKI